MTWPAILSTTPGKVIIRGSRTYRGIMESERSRFVWTPKRMHPSLRAGSHHQSSASDVKDAVARATTYVRATSEELEALHGMDRDKRASVINAKLRDRVKFDT
jgi:hypothetical protein